MCDNAKDMVLGEYSKKLQEASCHLRQTEPFTTMLNESEIGINESKKDSGRKLIKAGAPKRLWDDCYKLESCTQHLHTGWGGP